MDLNSKSSKTNRLLILEPFSTLPPTNSKQQKPQEIRIPSASKLYQYGQCPRSVIQTGQPINKPREKGITGSPAYVGQMLHHCLEFFVNNRINLKKSFQESYQAGLDISKQKGVLSQYAQMSKQAMDELTANAQSVMTEIPLIYNRKTKSVRRAQYSEAIDGDALVGTADMIVVNKDGSVVIADWKTGLDDVDGADANDQLAGLAWMAGLFFGFKKHYLAVINPVTKETDVAGPLDSVTFDYQKFLSVDVNAEIAGDHCRYCPLKKNCQSFMGMARKELVNAGFQDPQVVSGQQSGSDAQTQGQD